MRRWTASLLFLLVACSSPPTTKPGDPLKPDGEACTAASECTSGQCSQTADGLRCGPPAAGLKADGEPCAAASECQSGQCSQTPNGLRCGAPPTLKPDGEPCASASECESGQCSQTANGLRCGAPALNCGTCETANADATACVKVDAGTECGAPSCSSGFSRTSSCDASGACTSHPTNCGNYACDGATCRTSCTTSSDCVNGTRCDASNHCMPKLSLGTACTTADECASGFCETSLTGKVCAAQSCGACLLASADGFFCENVQAGTDPKNDCTADVATCKTDNCDGAGSCKAPTGTSCGATVCANSQLTRSTCNAAGSCQTNTTPCSYAFTCANATSCQTTCSTDAECGSNYYCNGGSCSARRSTGSNCTRNEMCSTGSCQLAPSGMVCAVANLNCGTCKVVDYSGTSCTNAQLGTDPKNECTADAANCKADTCDGYGTCKAAPGTTCAALSCSGSSVVTPVCGTTGQCNISNSSPCPNGYACANATSCGTSCASDAECASNYFCNGTTCTLKLQPGWNCTGNNQCYAGNCQPGQNGKVCATAGLTCPTCQVVLSNGAQCVNATSGTDPKNECNANNASCTADTCNGGGSCAATYGTVCGPNSCTGSTLSTPICSGGTCSAANTQTCANGYACDTNGTCRTSCTVNSDCNGFNYYCDTATSTCVYKKGAGAVCTDPSQCYSSKCVQAQNDYRCANVASCPSCQVISNGGGSCVNVTAGTDPKNDCTANLATCTTDNCNSAGNCLAPARASCGATTCSSGQETLSECTATGSCQTIPAPCANSGSCNGNTCAAPCGSDLDCPSADYCDPNGSCMPKHANGTVCQTSQANRCQSGNCVQAQNDFRCSAVSSCGLCQVVNDTGTYCTNASGGTDPKNECTYDPDPTHCKGDYCNGGGTCVDTTRAWYTCSGAYFTDRHYCNVDGTLGSFSSNCGGYTCDPNTNSCKGSCSSQNDCQPNYFCSGGVCR